MLIRFFLLIALALPDVVRAATPQAMLIVVSDEHSAYDRLPQLVARVDHLRDTHPGVPLAILVDGDAFEHGNGVARRTQGALDFAALAALAKRAPTVFTLGNHDADLVPMAELVARLRQLGISVISGNLRESGTGRPFASAVTRVELGRHTLTIVGVTTDHLSTFRASERNTLDIAPPVAWARENLPALLRGAELPVVMSHAGVTADRALLPLVPDGTLLVGGHDHLRFVHQQGRTVYFQSGSWLEAVSVVMLEEAEGHLVWRVTQEELSPSDRADPELAAAVRRTLAETLTPEETAIVARLPHALSPSAAAAFAVAAARDAAKADAAIIGGTTFGAGLPEGPVSRYAFDAAVRFDSVLCTAEVGGVELQRMLDRANQTAKTPLERRTGENLVAAAPEAIDPHRRYRVVTTDWFARDPAAYLGAGAPAFTPGKLQLKAVVLAALPTP